MKKLTLIFIAVLIVSCQMINNNVDHNNTPIVQQSPTVSQFSIISESCLQEGGDSLDSSNLAGELVLYKEKKYGLLKLDQNIFFELPETAYISPNGQKIAQYDEARNGIAVSDLDGNPLKFFQKTTKWTEANKTLYGHSLGFDPDHVWFDWWDNNSLFIRIMPIGSQLLLNTNNGDVKEIIFPYSEEVWTLGGSADIRDYFVSFSPDFDKVVYASSQFFLVLRNNSIYSDGTWRTVAWVGYSPTYNNPRWSSDGTKLLFVRESREGGIYDLYGIDAGAPLGERQLTDLGNLFDSPFAAWFGQYSWSSDGTRIAMVAHITPNEGGETFYHLLVLDLASGTIDDYCNPDPDSPYSSGFGFTWSPDGKYIATDTTIVDLNSRVVYKFPDVYIVDWVGEGKTQ